MRKFTLKISVFNPKAGKYRPEKLRIQTLLRSGKSEVCKDVTSWTGSSKKENTNNHQITNGNNKYNHHVTPIVKSINDKARKEVVIIGDSVLNNIKSRGLSKLKKVEVLNFLGAISNDIVGKIDDVLNQKPESLIFHVGTNDLANEINLLNSIKKCHQNKPKISYLCIKLF